MKNQEVSRILSRNPPPPTYDGGGKSYSELRCFPNSAKTPLYLHSTSINYFTIYSYLTVLLLFDYFTSNYITSIYYITSNYNSQVTKEAPWRSW